MRIEIMGSIATGKTSLCGNLKGKGLVFIPENLDDNPYKDKD